MADGKESGLGWKKWPLIIGGILLFLAVIAGIVFVFFFPTMLPAEGLQPPAIPEMFGRMGAVGIIAIVGIIFVVAVLFIVYEMFFKKRELHIVQEHHKIIKEATMLNPVDTLGMLVMSGKKKMQHYVVGKIVGHTQVPVNIERNIIIDKNGKEDPNLSETPGQYQIRKKQRETDGRGHYDFFAFLTGRGVYSMPIFNLFEPVKIFACYPSERSEDLIGDVEIFDIGSWKISGVNIYVPAQRNSEPMHTAKEFEAQLMPIAYMSLLDYLGLVAQRGVEGDTALQKWLQTKSSTVNVKPGSG